MNLSDIKNKNLESVIMHIATRFINVPYEEYELRLNEALALVGTFLDIDRVYVFDYDFDHSLTSNTYEWCNNDVEPQIQYLQNVPIEEIAEEWINKHQNREMVIYEDVDQLNHDSKIYQILNPQGIISICTIPLIKNDECVGFVGFDDIRQKRVWKDNDFKLLTVLAELIVNTQTKKHNDEALVVLREKAIQANEAKSKFLAHMSHEIRNPLNGIHNAVYLLSQANTIQEQENYIQIAQTSLDFLISIVNNILDISKIEAGKMEVFYQNVDIEYEIVRTIRALKAGIQQKNLNLIIDYDHTINQTLVIDMQKVNQILINLVNNSIKYTDFGYIKVIVKLNDNSQQPTLSISVMDTGVGISPEDQKKITEAFFQSSNQTSTVVGSGLGLSIVYQLVDLLGGKLNITSALNKGSCFEVVLPVVYGTQIKHDQIFNNLLLVSKDKDFLKQYTRFFEFFAHEVIVYDKNIPIDKTIDFIVMDESCYNRNLSDITNRLNTDQLPEVIVMSSDRNTKKSVEKTIYLPVSKKDFIQFLKHKNHTNRNTADSNKKFYGNILVVDDSMINREALKAIVVKHGLNCDVAIGGFQAIEMCETKKYDLILMDIQMPQIDGYVTAMKIRANERLIIKTPIVAVTANVFLNDYDVKMSSHIDKLLFKPVKIEELLNLFDEYLVSPIFYQIPKETLTFNIETINSIFEGNYTSAIAMIDQFVKDHDQDLLKIKEAIILEDQEKIFKVLHYYKGPLSYLGADRLIYLLSEMMKANQNYVQVTIIDYQQIHLETKHFIMALEDIKHDLFSR